MLTSDAGFFPGSLTSDTRPRTGCGWLVKACLAVFPLSMHVYMCGWSSSVGWEDCFPHMNSNANHDYDERNLAHAAHAGWTAQAGRTGIVF